MNTGLLQALGKGRPNSPEDGQVIRGRLFGGTGLNRTVILRVQGWDCLLRQGDCWLFRAIPWFEQTTPSSPQPAQPPPQQQPPEETIPETTHSHTSRIALHSPSYSTTHPDEGQPRPGRPWILPLALILLGLVLFPYLADQGLGFWGAGVCHRIVQRSFVVGGHALPLCARCSGLYLGFITTAVVCFLRGRRRPDALPPPGILVILFLFLAVVGVDGLNSYFTLFPVLPHLYEPHNTLRVVTGTLEGIAMAGIFLPILHMTLWWAPAEVRSVPDLRELGLILLAAVPLNLLALWHPRYAYIPLSILSLAGLFLALGTVNTLLVAVVSRRAGRVSAWKEAVTLFFWGCFLALLEMVALAWVRYYLLGSFDFLLP